MLEDKDPDEVIEIAEIVQNDGLDMDEADSDQHRDYCVFHCNKTRSCANTRAGSMYGRSQALS